MSGELKTHDYWFLGTDISFQISPDCTNIVDTTQVMHHFVTYRNWRTEHAYVDDTGIGITVHNLEVLPSDEYDRLWSEHYNLYMEIAQRQRRP